MIDVESFMKLYELESMSFYKNLDACFTSNKNEDNSFLEEYLKKSDIVAEIGSGAGKFTFNIAKYAKHVHAIDFIKKCTDNIEEKKIKNITTYNISAYKLNTLQCDFNVILFSCSLSQLSNPKRMLETAEKKLSENGRIIIFESEEFSDPCGNFYPNNLRILEKVCGKYNNYNKDDMISELLIPEIIDKEWLEKLAKTVNMKINRYRYIEDKKIYVSDCVFKFSVAELVY